MVAKGVFPKTDGSIYYADDVEIVRGESRASANLETIHRLPYTQTANSVTFTPGRKYFFSSFTLGAGATLTTSQSSTGEPIIIVVDGDCTIAGTIDLKGLGFSGGNGGGGAGSDPGLNGASYAPDTDWNSYFVGHGIGGASTKGGGGASGEGSNGTAGTSGGAAGTYTKVDGTAVEPDDILNMFNVVAGAGGGGGGGSTNPGGAGGNGGGAIVLIVSGNLDMTGGTINVSGNDGSAAAGANGGGGGGGAGGVIVLAYTGTYTSGTLTVAGGTGGAGAGTGTAGGNGGNGISHTFQIV